MKNLLDIITITKDDPDGVINTVESTRKLRVESNVRQIIVDSSSEEAQRRIRDFMSHEENVDYVWQKPCGIAPAFNFGLSRSEAKWVWFLNGRDEVHHELAPDNFLYLVKESRADAILFDLEFMQSKRIYGHPPMSDIWPPLFGWIVHPSAVIRKSLFEKYGTYNDKYKIAMDQESWFRFFSNNVIVDMISISIASFDEGGISNSQMTEAEQEDDMIIKSYLATIVKQWLKTGLLILKRIKQIISR